MVTKSKYLRRLSVASFTWLVPTLLRIFGFAFFAELVVALLQEKIFIKIMQVEALLRDEINIKIMHI